MLLKLKIILVGSFDKYNNDKLIQIQHISKWRSTDVIHSLKWKYTHTHKKAPANLRGSSCQFYVLTWIFYNLKDGSYGF